MRKSRRALLAAVIGGSLYAPKAMAESFSAVDSDPASSVLETIYVTARRTPEKEVDVPVSMTVVNAQTLNDNGITNILSLGEVLPTLRVVSFNPRNTSITIRGLGANVGLVNDGVEAGTGVYVDGVLYARPAQAVFDFPDIRSIEELRGPQGTLYGKNSVAGVININTLMPSTEFGGSAELSGGDFGYKRASATVTGALDDQNKVSGRLTLYDTDRNGFFRDTITQQKLSDYHDYGTRAQLLYQPSSDIALRLVGDYSHFKSRAPAQVITSIVTTLANGQSLPSNFYQRSAAAGYTPLPVNPFSRLIDANSPILSEMEQGGGTLHADWTGENVTLTSISAYRFWNWRPANDNDLTSLNVLTQTRQANDEREFTQELRLASRNLESVELSGGLFFFWEEDDGVGFQQTGADAPVWALGTSNAIYQTALNGFSVNATSNPRTNSYAAYAHAVWHVSPKLDISGGIRFTYEHKTGGYFQAVAGASTAGLSTAQMATVAAIRSTLAVSENYYLSTSNDLIGASAAITYRVTDEATAYLLYSHGEKSAGLDLANLPIPVPKIIAPETVDNYEAGMKLNFLNGRLAVNSDVFWDEDANYQTSLWSPTNLVTYLANIPSVRSRGFETDIVAALLEGLIGRFSAAYTDATFLSFPNAPVPFEDYTVIGGQLNTKGEVDLSNQPLPSVSKWVFSAGLEYDGVLMNAPSTGLIRFHVGADESYRSRYYSSGNLSIYSIVPGYGVANVHAGIGLPEKGLDVDIWAHNVFDRNYLIGQSPIVFNSGAIGALLGDPRTVGISLNQKF